MVHKQGIKAVSDQRLLRRGNGVYYYRRRVPLPLVEKIGMKVVQISLHTTNVKEAKKRRTMCDLQWDARFEACSISSPDDKAPCWCPPRILPCPRRNWSSWSATTWSGRIRP